MQTAELTYQNEKKHEINLIRATIRDQNVVMNIMFNSFKNDPHMRWMLEKSKNPNKLKHLMFYIFNETIKTGDIYLTENHSAVALWKSEKKEKISFEYIKRNVSFLFQVGIKSVIRILQNERYTHKQYPLNDKFYHLYLIGVLPNQQGKGYASALLNPILEKMENKSIPVYLETANINNIDIYEKKGFKVYNSWLKSGLELFYMKKE